ncbi:MAG: hypothetical protein JW866_08550, partial [Ignavibacteriales bacterium]|nr:hypothetical protein [Ignavibacteriales bacterium]
AFANAKGNNFKKMKEILKNKGIQRKQVPEYKKLYLELGVNKETEEEITKYTKRALLALKNLSDEKSRNILIWLANQMLKRKS